MVNLQKNDREGWIVKSNQQAAVMVAPWVVEEEKKTLALCLVGFMKSPSGGIREVEVWLANTWGGHPISIKTLDTDVLLLQLSSDVELEGILSGAREFHSPCIAIERWMEVSVIVEEENEDYKDMSCPVSINNSEDVRNFRIQRGSCRGCEDDDKDKYCKNSNFENPSTVFGSSLQDMGPLKSSRWLTQQNQNSAGLLGRSLKQGSGPCSLTTHARFSITHAVCSEHIKLATRVNECINCIN
ncbi:hypothetical protein AAC387_Pa03g4507 [Persea americana]